MQQHDEYHRAGRYIARALIVAVLLAGAAVCAAIPAIPEIVSYLEDQP